MNWPDDRDYPNAGPAHRQSSKSNEATLAVAAAGEALELVEEAPELVEG